MKTITINARNTTREFEASDIDTVMTVLAHADVRTLFGFDDDATDECVSTLVGHIQNIQNGNETYDLTNMSEGFKKAILNAVLEDEAIINIDFYAAENDDGDPIDEDEKDNDIDDDEYGDYDEDKDADDKEEAPRRATGEIRHGIVKVTTNGGMVSTNVEIEDGKSTVQDAIYSDIVQARSAMDETAISNCSVVLNGDVINANNIATRVLHSGDTIDLTPRFAATKGLAD